jgi:phosphoserine phosphatase
MLTGIDSHELMGIFRQIPFQEHVHLVVQHIRKKKIISAVVTDGYQIFADDLKQRLQFDYAFGNNLKINNHIITGKITLHNKTLQPCSDGKIYSICKSAVMKSLCQKLGIKNNEVIAVGDGIVDMDMISHAGLGIAFHAPEVVSRVADLSIDDLRTILQFI